MGRFVVNRLLRAIPVLFGVTLVLAATIYLIPGDPGRSLLGAKASQEEVDRLDHQLGVDDPPWQQYTSFLDRLFSGSLGTSLKYQESVGSLVLDRLPITIWLLVYSALLVAGLTIPLAAIAAAKEGALPDHVVRGLMVISLGIPTAVAGLLLLQAFAIDNRVFPAGGFGSGFFDHLQSLFLPSLALALSILPLAVRSLRTSMIRILRSDHVVTARAKGLSERRVWTNHILRNASPPALVVIAVNLAFLVGGTVVVEYVFSIPGLGALMLDGIKARDFAVVQGVALVFALIVIFIQIASDVGQAALDPRVKLE